ncbi:MAG: hypothetical protein HY924_04565 [Elusimicrobia bacterium]|nr:hypothetical protein [Elusimicrobiota bacterium]
MDFDELKTRLVLAAGVVSIVGGFFWWQISSARNAAIEEARSAEEVPVLEPGGSPRRPLLDKAYAADRSGAKAEALTLARQALAEAVEPADQEASRGLVTRLLVDDFRASSKEGSLDKAEALWKELSGLRVEGRGHPAVWELQDWLRRELTAGKVETSRKLLALTLISPLKRDDIRGYGALKDFRKLLLERRSEALAAGRKEEAEALFLEAAGLEPWGEELRKALDGTPPAELMSAGRRLLSARRFSASLAHFEAAWESRDLDEPVRAAIPELRDECWWGLADEAEAAGLIGSDAFISAVSFLERVDGARAKNAASRLAALLEDDADRAAAEKRFGAAHGLLSMAESQVKEAWNKRAFGAPPDLWTGVAPEAASRIRAGFAPGVEQSNELSRGVMVDDGASSPLLEVRRLAGKRQAVDFDWAVDEVSKDPEQGLRKLRVGLRLGPAPEARARAETAVRAGLKVAIAKDELGRLVDLAAFLISEFGGPAPGDPFHGELLTSLQAAAKEYEASEVTRSIFILSLIADAFPAEEAGRTAREEAGVKGLAFFQKTSERESSGRPMGPSGLAGLSVVSVENATEHHILIFYDGPERFFLRLNPYRRASAALRDGTYGVGVLASADEIVPYRARTPYQGSRVLHRYVIEIRGSASGQKVVYPASGDWVLLRVPPGQAGLAADPRTGQVSVSP